MTTIVRTILALTAGCSLAACSRSDDADAGAQRVVVVDSRSKATPMRLPSKQGPSTAFKQLPERSSSYETTSREATVRGEKYLQPIKEEKTLWFD